MDKVQPLRSHQEELPPRREMPQNESVHAAVGTLQLRVELGDEMCVVTILKMITYTLISRPTFPSPGQSREEFIRGGYEDSYFLN